MNPIEIIDYVEKETKGKEVIPIHGYENTFSLCRKGVKGVAIKYDGEKDIDVHFANLYLKKAVLSYGNETFNILLLYSKKEDLNNHFGAMFLDFIDVEHREKILNNPFVWFNEWKEILGNTISKKRAYDVIGELKAFSLLIEAGEHPIWNSMEKGTYDITSNKKLYEIKSTVMRIESSATINNIYQLSNEDELHLLFVRLEKNEAGESIDDLFNKIFSLGYKEIDEVETYLCETGYQKGTEERYEKYIVHEIRDYFVDDDFPKITLDSFKENHLPKGVMSIKYTVSLEGLKYTSFNIGDSKYA